MLRRSRLQDKTRSQEFVGPPRRGPSRHLVVRVRVGAPNAGDARLGHGPRELVSVRLRLDGSNDPRSCRRQPCRVLPALVTQGRTKRMI